MVNPTMANSIKVIVVNSKGVGGRGTMTERNRDKPRKKRREKKKNTKIREKHE